MSLKRRLKREIQRQVARDGAASVIARLDAASERTDRELREEQARNRIEDTKTVLALMMAIPTTVLCRDLPGSRWKGRPPITGGSCGGSQNSSWRNVIRYSKTAPWICTSTSTNVTSATV